MFITSMAELEFITNNKKNANWKLVCFDEIEFDTTITHRHTFKNTKNFEFSFVLILNE